jgi:hypothetical protein
VRAVTDKDRWSFRHLADEGRGEVAARLTRPAHFQNWLRTPCVAQLSRGRVEVNTEYRFDHETAHFNGGDWQIDDANALMRHRWTGVIFSIYIAPSSDSVPSLHQLRARIAHICDGMPDNLPELAGAAMFGYVCMTNRVEFAALDPADDEDIPF